MTTFTETAMADRFKAAIAELEPKTMNDASKYLLEQIEGWDARSNDQIDAKSSVAIILEYMHKWATGEYTDADLVQMLGIRLNNIAIALSKKETGL
jgi:hypothetical protein